MVPLVLPPDSADSIDAPTFISENWAVLACVGAAGAALQLDLSRVGVFVAGHHATRAESTAWLSTLEMSHV